MNKTSTRSKVLSWIITSALGLQLANCKCPETQAPPPDAGATCDVELTECTDDLFGFVNGMLAAINAIQVPLDTRTVADKIPCPADTGVGESAVMSPDHVNIFSYVGPLPKGCNRTYADDCADPARSNYWVAVVDDRRASVYATDPYSFRIIWGGREGDYTYYGACYPIGFDNPVAGIPKLVQAVNDVDKNGSIGDVPNADNPAQMMCSGQSHVYLFRFYVPDGNGGRTYIEKGNIAQISNPYLSSSDASLPGVPSADREELFKSGYVTVDITLKDPEGQTITAFIENNSDGSPLVEWKEQAPSCGR